MKIETVLDFKPEKEKDTNILNVVSTNLIVVDRFLTYLKEHKENLLDIFISNLEKKYRSASHFEYKINFNQFEDIKDKFHIVQDHPKLITSLASLVLSTLILPFDYNWDPPILKIPQVIVTKAWLIPKIFFSELLTEMIDRKEAIKFLKDYFVFYVKIYRNVVTHENLTTVFETDIENGRRGQNTKCVSAMLNEGVYVSRVDRCMAPEALKDYTDSEIKHLVCCSADHTIVKKANEYFALTRTTTLMDGDFCDFCCHDTRIVDEITHPPREFFEIL